MNKAELIGAVSKELGDQRTSEAAVEAIIDTITRAVVAGDRVAVAYDPYDVVAGLEVRVRGRLPHAAERLVAEDQPFAAVRRLAVIAGDDLAIGAADAERQRIDQDRAFGLWRLVNLL